MATTLKTAVPPCKTVWATGWLTMPGLMSTKRKALLLVIEPIRSLGAVLDGLQLRLPALGE